MAFDNRGYSSYGSNRGGYSNRPQQTRPPYQQNTVAEILPEAVPTDYVDKAESIMKELQNSRPSITTSKIRNLLSLTEVKFENGINRQTAVANPRQIERVNPGVHFGVNIVYEMRDTDTILSDMELLAKGFKLLQLDYLGGHGSRGSGRVSFRNFSFEAVDADTDTEEIQRIFSEVEGYELFAF